MNSTVFSTIDTGNGSANTGTVRANCKQITVIGIKNSVSFGEDSGATIVVNNIIAGVLTPQTVKVCQGIPLNFSYESGFWPELEYNKGTADRLIIYFVY